MENRCVVCGEIIPEGRQVCPNCEAGQEPKKQDDDVVIYDGTVQIVYEKLPITK